MKRVKWKGPYVDYKILKKIKDLKMPSNKINIKNMKKNFIILPKFIGVTLKIYNGKTFLIIKINEEMVGYKLGEFISTRKQFSYKKKK